MVPLRAGTFLLIFVLPTLAQTQPTGEPRGVAGIVKDATGAIVPKATVTLFSPAGERVGSTFTGKDGTFRLAAQTLSEGQLEIRREGFKPFLQHIYISTNLKPITAVLQIADLSQQIDVSAAADANQVSTDPAQNRDAAVLNDNMLEQLPALDQDYIGAVSNFLDQGAAGNMGTTIVVDGMEQKDAGVTPSAVQDVKINNDPYSAEFSRPGRGRIEITTKTPDSVFHGTANVIFRDSISTPAMLLRPRALPNSAGFLKEYSPGQCPASIEPFFCYLPIIDRTTFNRPFSHSFLPDSCKTTCPARFALKTWPHALRTTLATITPEFCNLHTKAAHGRTNCRPDQLSMPAKIRMAAVPDKIKRPAGMFCRRPAAT